MTFALRQFWLLVSKDLRIEARSRQTLGLVIVMGLLVITVLGRQVKAEHIARVPAQDGIGDVIQGRLLCSA